MAKRGFILYHDYREQMCSLSDVACGKLIKAIFDYEIDGIMPSLPSKAAMAFMFIRNSLDENKSKYAEVCKKRSEAAKKSHESRNSANAGKCLHLHANAANTDTETKTETNTVTVLDTERETETVQHAEQSGGECEFFENVENVENVENFSEQKAQYGEYGNVFLTGSEYESLVKEYGRQMAEDAVNLLSSRIARDNRYHNENHYATIRDWVIMAVGEQRARKQSLENREWQNEKNKKPTIAGLDFDFDDIFNAAKLNF